MTHAKRTARACRLTAGLSTICAFYAAAWHPWYAAPGLLGALILVLVAADYQIDDILRHDRHAQLVAARLSDERLLPTPCCAFWEQPDGQHATTCRNHEPRTAA
ncbi:hypothetical protein KBZ00_25900 [Streptomyces sp. RK31]|uniref:hypothetical protein n=1 Tax=Streptomyces sp. RK31 TaxID=2824892 RepID=UPI001B39B589|nr:hypothetical protein [Streptomyces sp. RK31]MBQ0974534.1 hypothetical protein [Streptomyces sp. RK31]